MYKYIYIYTGGGRIIERSQEYKSTVKYRTFVLLRVPIPRGVGKFPRSIIKWDDDHSIFLTGNDLE